MSQFDTGSSTSAIFLCPVYVTWWHCNLVT